jgi:thiosulfate dehydrogenase
VLGTSLSAQALFDLLKADPAVTPNGHDLDAFGMTDRDLWDVIKMTLDSVVDTDDYIAANGTFLGDEPSGNFLYYSSCWTCHGDDGKYLNFGDAENPEYVGTIASQNPWEFLHKVRFGHPGSPMPASDRIEWPIQYAADVGAFCETLPVD